MRRVLRVLSSDWPIMDRIPGFLRRAWPYAVVVAFLLIVVPWPWQLLLLGWAIVSAVYAAIMVALECRRR